MPGPGSKAKKSKARSRTSAASQSNGRVVVLEPLINDIDNADGWNAIVNVLCRYFDLPDLTTRSGLKKVYANFETYQRRLDATYSANFSNEKIMGGIVGIYTKICADSILRTKLVQNDLLSKILPLIELPECRHLALRALTTVTHHGGAEVREGIALKTAQILIKVIQENPDDLKSAELAISSLSHSVGAVLDNMKRPSDKTFRVLDVPTLMRVLIDVLRKPGISLDLTNHARELLGLIPLHCSREFLAFPAAVDFLIASLRSTDIIARCSALAGLLRLYLLDSEDDERARHPQKMIEALKRGFPPHLSDILMNYGPDKCDTFLTVRSLVDSQKAFLKVGQDHNLYELGLTIAELIPRNEYSVANGGYQVQDPRTGNFEERNFGLPFTRWTDALPHCAKAMRKTSPTGEDDAADMVDMKYFIMSSRIKEAVALAKKTIERNPHFPYSYYAVTMGFDHAEGLRAAKKGLKCKTLTPFLRFGLMHRAVEIAGDMGICLMQQARPGDQKWVESVAFLTSSLKDAETYVAEAPPDARHMKNVSYWYILLTLALKGHELSPELRELQTVLMKLKAADEFGMMMGITPPKTQLRLAQQTLLERYSTAMNEWGSKIEAFDQLIGGTQAEHIITPARAEDDFAAWLEEVHLDNGEEDDAHLHRCANPKFNPSSIALYTCAWCGNPSALLRKCGGCAKIRYCDNACQKSHWSAHKATCKS